MPKVTTQENFLKRLKNKAKQTPPVSSLLSKPSLTPTTFTSTFKAPPVKHNQSITTASEPLQNPDNNISYIKEQNARQAQKPLTQNAVNYFSKLGAKTLNKTSKQTNQSSSFKLQSFKNIHSQFAPPSALPKTVLQTTQHDPPAAYLVIQTDTNGELVHVTMPVGSTLKPLTDRETMYLISVSDPINKDSYTIKTRVSGEKSVENLRKELNKVPLPPRNIQRTTAGLDAVKAQTVLKNKIDAFSKQAKNVRTTGAYDATISSAQSVVDAATDAKEKTQRLLDILQNKQNNNSVKKSTAVAQHDIEYYESVLIDYNKKIVDLQQNKRNTALFTGTQTVNPPITTSTEAAAFARGMGGKRRTTVRRQQLKRAVKRSSRK